jgi:DcaP outer membrane protein
MYRRTDQTHPYLSSIKNLLFRVAAFSLLFVAVSAIAQETDKVQELQRVIDTQQRQLKAQQRQLEDQMQVLRRLQSEVERLAKSTDEDRTTPRESGAPTQSPSGSAKVQTSADEKSTLSSADTIESRAARRPKRTGVAQTDRFDSESPSSVDATYFDPKAVINIPGTKTGVGLHGFAMFQIIHDTNGPDGNQFDTAFIPVDGAPSETKFNVNPSRIFFTSYTPVSDGQLNTLISMDFNGQVDRPDPRLRVAYGEYVNKRLGFGVLGGQTFATMADLRAVPETLDFAVPAGSWAQRQGLLRLTKAFRGGILMETSIETPQNVRYINADKRTRLPDAVLAGTWMLNGDYLRHFRLGALARDLRADGDDGGTDSAFGWAVSASAKVDLPFLGKRDNLRLTAHFGDGYGTQLKGGPEEAVFDTASSELDTIGIWSSFGGIQHFWAEKFRSNLTFGHVKADNPALVPSDALDSTTYASANFIWNPYKQLTLGVEYLWGRRENVGGASGTSNRLLFSSRLDF